MEAPPEPLPAPEAASDAAVPTLDEADGAARYDEAPALDVQHGKAAYYASSLAGRRTASGEVYDPEQLTAAHRTLPFGTVVRILRPGTDRRVTVRITDRGPFGNEARIIDLSRAAAERLDMLREGVVDVRLEIVEYGAR